MIMWFLPIFCWMLLVLLLVRKGQGVRQACLVAAISWGVAVTCFTELLSLFGLLTWAGLAICWTVAATVGVFLHCRQQNSLWSGQIHSYRTSEKWFLCSLALICLVTLITAVLAPPNDWDSMTYHMSRVMHWLQNRSVAHFPTHNLRQIDMNPWSEFAIAHFQALSGGDRYANLVQWFSMLGSLAGVSLIAKQLGGEGRAQLVAAVIAATIPMGLLQASTTQNDYVVAFWLMCLVWTGLQLMKEASLKWSVLAGASLGLAVLTKGTAYIYAFPFAAWFGIAILQRFRRRALSVLVIVLAMFLLMNFMHFQRNYALFSSPLTSGIHHLENETINHETLISNILRNVAVQLASPSQAVNEHIVALVSAVHNIFGIDPNDRATTWAHTKFVLGSSWLSEIFAGNPLHVVLVLSVIACLVCNLNNQRFERSVFVYSCVLGAAFLLFCLVLKWQPWHNRLLLPLMIMGAPVTGVAVEKCWRPGFRWVLMVLLFTSLPYLFSSQNRPHVRLLNVDDKMQLEFPLWTMDRNRLYFMSQPGMYSQFYAIANDAKRKNARTIGIVMSSWDAWEYPFWVLVRDRNPQPVHIEHFQVENPSRLLRKTEYKPDYAFKIVAPNAPVP